MESITDQITIPLSEIISNAFIWTLLDILSAFILSIIVFLLYKKFGTKKSQKSEEPGSDKDSTNPLTFSIPAFACIFLAVWPFIIGSDGAQPVNINEVVLNF